MSKKLLPKEVVKAATDSYLINSMSMADAGLPYGVSATTIARELAERGLKNLRKYKTEEEYRMMNLLRAHSITNTEALQELLDSI